MLERVGRVRRIIGEHLEHDHPGRAVDRGVVRLLQQRPAPVGQPLDDVRLPQRARTIHFAADDSSDLLGELVACAGRGETDVTYVKVDIEVRVLDPIGAVEFERHLDHLAAKRLKVTDHDAQPVSHLGERVEIQPTGARRCSARSRARRCSASPSARN